jgi:hypothetical protein
VRGSNATGSGYGLHRDNRSAHRRKQPDIAPQLVVSGDKVAILFSYRPAMVRELRLTGAAFWSPERKCWLTRKEKTCLRALVSFVHRFNFSIDPGIRAQWAEIPEGRPVRPRTEDEIDQPRLTRREVVLDSSKVIVRFPYDPDDVAAVRQAGVLAWNGEARQWEAPVCRLAIETLAAWAADHGFDFNRDAFRNAWKEAK